MLKNIVLGMLLIAIFLLTRQMEPLFASPSNIGSMLRWTGLYGIMTIGAAFVIISGGIDLSIGSMIALIGAQFGILILEYDMNPYLAMVIVLTMAALIGLIYGLLITKLKLQPFVVTLCGLLVLRSIARYLTNDDMVSGFVVSESGESIKYLTASKFGGLPLPLWMLGGVALVAGVVLNHTVFGRYLKALGNNEQAARYSGIQTDNVTIAAYIICSFLAGVTGILYAIDLGSVAPNTTGTFFELYAIAAAVLGGCSLRGGVGSIIGVLIGTAILRMLYQAIATLKFAEMEGTVIGVVILIGVVIDEIIHRVIAARRKKREMPVAPTETG